MSRSWQNWRQTFHAARGTFLSEVWWLPGRGCRPRPGSQTKERKVPLKAWKGLPEVKPKTRTLTFIPYRLVFSLGGPSTVQKPRINAAPWFWCQWFCAKYIGANNKLMDAPRFKEFPWKLQGRSPCNFPIIRSLWMPPVSKSSPENCRGKAPAIFP